MERRIKINYSEMDGGVFKMKILLLEDKGKKQQKIKSVLASNNHDVTLVCSVNDFREEVARNAYDVAIIDLYVPDKNTKPTLNTGGFNAIRYIRDTTDAIYSPKHMLVLSQFLNDDVIVKLNALNVKGILYSSNDQDTKWVDDMNNELDQILKTTTPKVDVVIVSAVDVENDQLQKVFNNAKELDIDDDVIFSQASVMNTKKETITIVTCQQLRKGMVAAANLATKAIEIFNPDCILMLGIAGGNANEVQSGDIVVASLAIDYCSGRVSDNSTPGLIDFTPDSQPITVSAQPVRTFRRYANNTNLLRQIRDNCGDLRQDRDINLKIGKMATGPVVVRSPSFSEKYIMTHHKDYLAIDMETYGVYYAAKYCRNPNIEFASIKSISDVADSNKSDEFQKYCSRLTANLVHHYLTNDYKKKY